ncbi:MAG: tRNA epoxyqueuosine(34) reductase QueG [Phycisphaerales bacterium]
MCSADRERVGLDEHEGARLGGVVCERARAMGFALAGVCEARQSDFGDELRAWLAAGRHGEMGWLGNHVEQRIDPGRFVEGCRALVLVGDVYEARGVKGDAGTRDDERDGGDVDGAGGEGAGVGRVARYARGDDYHQVIKKRLHALCDALRAEFPGQVFRAFTDTAPVLEREHAARAGLGWIGKHTLLIHPRAGSYMLLGGIATTMALRPPQTQRAVTDHCGTCTRCIDACPTGAITERSVDATKCIAYLTIEHRSPVAPEFHRAIGDWLFGCDVCQEVCPHNSPRPPGGGGAGVASGAGDAGGGTAGESRSSANPAYAPRRTGFDALEVLGWTPEDRSAALRGSAMKRATLAMLKRNALIVLANVLVDGEEVDGGQMNGGLGADERAAIRARIEAVARGEGGEDALVVRTARELVEGHAGMRACGEGVKRR